MDKKSVFTSKSFLSARGMTKIFMAFAIIGFSMPFLTISCGTNMITSVSGYELISGKNVYLVDKWADIPMNFMILLSFITCIITLVAAFLPQYPQSRMVWGASSAIGLMILVMYYLSSVSNVMQEVARRIGYDVSAQMLIMPGRGLILCMLLQVSSLIMLIRKSFFEEPDLLPLTIDETEIIKTVAEEAQEEAKERELLHRELAEKLAPIEQKRGKEALKQTPQTADESTVEAVSTPEVTQTSETVATSETSVEQTITPETETAQTLEAETEPVATPEIEPVTVATQSTPASEPATTPEVEQTSETVATPEPTSETSVEQTITPETEAAQTLEAETETVATPEIEPVVEPDSNADDEPIPTYESIPKPKPMVEQEPEQDEKDESSND